MIDREYKLPIKRQSEVLGISRGTAYSKPRPVSERDLDAKTGRAAPELPIRGQPDVARSAAAARARRGPFAQLSKGLSYGKDVGVAHLENASGVSHFCHSSGYEINSSDRAEFGGRSTRPNQVWAMDMSYIPMARGFVYLAAVVDWFSRRIPSWKLSIAMDVPFCLEPVEDALSMNEKPEIFKTDQGSQFSSVAFIGLPIQPPVERQPTGPWPRLLTADPSFHAAVDNPYPNHIRRDIETVRQSKIVETSSRIAMSSDLPGHPSPRYRSVGVFPSSISELSRRADCAS